VERRYSEEQVSEIIRRAAEISSNGVDSSLARGSGISESELKRIASEIGLEASAVDTAMRETGSVVSQDTGGALSYERSFERRIQGYVGEEAHATLVEHFVPEWDPFRGTTKIGSMVSYKSSVGTNTCHVSITQKSGRTTLKVTSNAWVSMMATFLPAVLLSVLSAILVFSSTRLAQSDKPELFLASLLVLWTAAVVANIKLVKFSNKKVERLVDAAASELAESADHLRGRLEAPSLAADEASQTEQLT
jgi:hypothetical protein